MEEANIVQQNNQYQNVNTSLSQTAVEKTDKNFLRNKWNLYLLIFILVCLVGSMGFYIMSKPSPKLVAGSFYKGMRYPPEGKQITTKIAILSIEGNKMKFEFLWDNPGVVKGSKIVEATLIENNTFTWSMEAEKNDPRPRYTFRLEKDGSLKGTRQKGKETRIILMKKINSPHIN